MAKKAHVEDEWALTHFCATNWEGLQFDDWMPVGTRYLLFGKNNSGKSSFVRLLRLVGLLTLPIPWRVFDESYVEGGLHNKETAKGAPEKGPRPYALLRDPMNLAAGSEILKKVAEPRWLQQGGIGSYLENKRLEIERAVESAEVHTFTSFNFCISLRLLSPTSEEPLLITLHYSLETNRRKKRREFTRHGEIETLLHSEEQAEEYYYLPFKEQFWKDTDPSVLAQPVRSYLDYLLTAGKTVRCGSLQMQRNDLSIAFDTIKEAARRRIGESVSTERLGEKNFERSSGEFLSGLARMKLKGYGEHTRDAQFLPESSQVQKLMIEHDAGAGLDTTFISRKLLLSFFKNWTYNPFELIGYSIGTIMKDCSRSGAYLSNPSEEYIANLILFDSEFWIRLWVNRGPVPARLYEDNEHDEDIPEREDCGNIIQENEERAQSSEDEENTFGHDTKDNMYDSEHDEADSDEDQNDEKKAEATSAETRRHSRPKAYYVERIDRPVSSMGKGTLWIISNLILLTREKEQQWFFEHIENFLHPSLAADFFQDIVELTPFSVFETHEEALLLRAQWMIAHDRIPATNVVTLIFDPPSPIKRTLIRDNGDLSAPFPDGYAELLFYLDPRGGGQ